MVEPDSEHLSPDGRIRISYRSEEIRMSQFVDVPHVTEVETGRTLFKPHSSLVSAQHEWGEDGQFALHLRKYPDGASMVTLHFDIDRDTVTRVGDDQGAQPISQGARLAEEAFRGPAPEIGIDNGPRETQVNRLAKLYDYVSIAFVVAVLLGGVAIALGWL